MRHILGFLFVCCFALVGCTKDEAKVVLCDTGKTAAGFVSTTIAVQLECKNQDAIRADVEAKLVDLKICEAPKPAPEGKVGIQSAIGDVICKPVIDGLVAGLLTQIPSKWECSGGKVTDDLKLKLLAACSKAL